jgi:putative NADH-flavin reductase
MRLLILGATGKIGTELVNQALSGDVGITALVRSAKRMRASDCRLAVIEGDPLDEGTLAQALPGHDAAVSVLGHADLKPGSFVTAGAAALVQAMKRLGMRRMLIISSTLVAPGGSFLTGIPRRLTRHALVDSATMELVIETTPLDWTIVRLVRLTNGPLAPYRVFEPEPPSVTASISRASVAACLLNLVDDRTAFRKTVGVSAR